MFQQLLLVLVIQFGLAVSALAEPSKPTGEALRQAMSGRTVLIETQIGAFPICYKSDGTMTGQAPCVRRKSGNREGPRPMVGGRRSSLPALAPMAGRETILL